jgi:hypothetical protein
LDAYWNASNIQYPASMDRRDWISAFVAELVRLRPHLADAQGFANRAAHAVAVAQYRPHVDPADAARRYHASAPAPKATRR